MVSVPGAGRCTDPVTAKLSLKDEKSTADCQLECQTSERSIPEVRHRGLWNPAIRNARKRPLEVLWSGSLDLTELGQKPPKVAVS